MNREQQQKRERKKDDVGTILRIDRKTRSQVELAKAIVLISLTYQQE